MKKCYTFRLKNCLRAGLLLVLVVSSAGNVLAQTAPAKQWDKTIGSFGSDYLAGLHQTADGGFILGGTSAGYGGGDRTTNSFGQNDFWIVKLTANGTIQWDKSFGGTEIDALFSLHPTPDGGYILGGSSRSGISGNKSQASRGGEDFWIIKLDGSGNKIWDKTFGGSDDDNLKAVIPLADGGYLLGGASLSGISGDRSQASRGNIDFWIIRTDAFGNKLWDKAFGGDNTDKLETMQAVAGGGFLLGGTSFSSVSGDKSQPSNGASDFWIIKLDAAGNKTWDKTFGGNFTEELFTLQQTQDGGYILGGGSDSGISGNKSQANRGGSDFWVIKTDSVGNKTWDGTFGGSNYDMLRSLKQTMDGGYILGGQSESPVNGDKSQPSQGLADYWMVRLDAAGNKLWDKTIGGRNGDHFQSLVYTSDGGFLLGGYSNSAASGDKTSSPKQLSYYDYWVVKLAPDVLLGTHPDQPAFQTTLSPNPNHGKFHLQLTDLRSSAVTVTITDLLGREIFNQQFLVAGGNKLSEEISIHGTSKGMYLLQVKAGNRTVSRKILVD